MSTKRLLVAGGLACLLIGCFITTRGNDLPQGKLNVQAAPSEATILVDEKSAKPGERNVDIGPHKIKVVMEGFKPYETTVTVTQADPTYVGVILDPDSPDTRNWYKD
ncbi:MAG TPA: PEGA domain-containing protein, partial [Candidatus Saccharimonadales bacterium]|nr:PEGA domain-containing protein [Candidatus Saccharimonadales bacterium]